MLLQYRLSGHLCHKHSKQRTRPAEHVQHPLSDKEATANIDGGDESCSGSQSLDSVGWVVPTPHEQQATHSSDARDGIGDGHKWGVEGWYHTPHSVVTWQHIAMDTCCKPLGRL